MHPLAHLLHKCSHVEINSIGAHRFVLYEGQRKRRPEHVIQIAIRAFLSGHAESMHDTRDLSLEMLYLANIVLETGLKWIRSSSVIVSGHGGGMPCSVPSYSFVRAMAASHLSRSDTYLYIASQCIIFPLSSTPLSSPARVGSEEHTLSIHRSKTCRSLAVQNSCLRLGLLMYIPANLLVSQSKDNTQSLRPSKDRAGLLKT